MSILDRVIKEYAVKKSVSRTEYEKAKSEMTSEDFNNQYGADEISFYKLLYADEKEIPVLILDKINTTLNTIKGWILFFGILTIIGLVGAIVWILISNSHGSSLY